MLASFPSFTLTAFSRNWLAPWKERKPEAMTFSFPCKSAEKDEGTHFSSLLFVLTKKRNLCACDTNQWFLLLLLLLAVLLNHHVHVLRRSPRHICLCKSEDWLMDIFYNTSATSIAVMSHYCHDKQKNLNKLTLGPKKTLFGKIYPGTKKLWEFKKWNLLWDFIKWN